MAVVFEASTSPLVGREGEIVGARQLKERLAARGGEQHLHAHRARLEDKIGIEVAGRGVLHLSVLMETMRREGFEFQVGRPRVIIKKDDGRPQAGAHRGSHRGRAERIRRARPSRCSAAPAAR